MNVYSAICAVAKDMAAVGISKDRKNQQQGYSFRGIDDVYNTLSPLLAKHGLCILPRVLSRECTERASAKGGTLFNVVVEVEFDLVADDGSKHTIKTYGEAMDSADKATNKAMSAAYKYAAFQTFAIPTEGDNDADAHSHDVAPKSGANSRAETLAAYKHDIDCALPGDQRKTVYEAAIAYARAQNDRQFAEEIKAYLTKIVNDEAKLTA